MSTAADIRRALHVDDSDKVVAAWAETSSWPGWNNSVVWVLLCDVRGKYRVECLQPQEWAMAGTVGNHFEYSRLASNLITQAVRNAAGLP